MTVFSSRISLRKNCVNMRRILLERRKKVSQTRLYNIKVNSICLLNCVNQRLFCCGNEKEKNEQLTAEQKAVTVAVKEGESLGKTADGSTSPKNRSIH